MEKSEVEGNSAGSKAWRHRNLSKFLNRRNTVDSVKKFAVTPSQLERLQVLFREVDSGKNGILTTRDLTEIYERSLRPVAPGLEVPSMLRDVVSAGIKHAGHNDGVLDYEEFLEHLLVRRSTWASQHWAKIETGFIIGWFALSPLLYCRMSDSQNRWSVWDALYFAASTVTTIGYGDLVPETDEMKVFTIFYIFAGLGMVGRGISECSEYLVMKYEANLRLMYNHLSANGGHFAFEPSHFMAFHDVSSTPIDNRVTKIRARIREWCRSKQSTMRAASVVAPLVVIPVVVGAAFVYHYEEWSVVDSLYWACVTITSVGYGDVVVKRQSSRTFAFFFILIGLSCIGAAFARVASFRMERRIEKKRKELLSRTPPLDLLADLDRDGHGIDRCDFVCAMLVQTNQISLEDIQLLLKRFDELDTDNNGMLTKDDLEVWHDRKRWRKQTIQRQLKRLTLVANRGDDEGV